MRRVRGFIGLAFEMVDETTRLVERSHDAVVARTTRRLGAFVPADLATGGVPDLHRRLARGTFAAIRTINRLACDTAETVADLATALPRAGHAPAPDGARIETAPRSPVAEQFSRNADRAQALVNAVRGDRFGRHGDRLDLGMTLRHRRRHLAPTPEALAAAFPAPTNRVCVFVHGLAATEYVWDRDPGRPTRDPGGDHGRRLRAELGFTPIHVRYNTGRHVSENGRELSRLLALLLRAYPVPIEEIALVGHSMGGLVARSAAHYGSRIDEPWVTRLRHVACIGSPNLGAPLEKVASLLTTTLGRFDSAGARIPAELLSGRSAGIKDLRYGYTVDEEWMGKDPDVAFVDSRLDVPLVDGVRYSFLAASISDDPDHLAGRLLGDLLVRVSSASGEAADSCRRIRFSGGARLSGMHHLEMTHHPEVSAALVDLLSAGPPGCDPPPRHGSLRASKVR